MGTNSIEGVKITDKTSKNARSKILETFLLNTSCAFCFIFSFLRIISTRHNNSVLIRIHYYVTKTFPPSSFPARNEHILAFCLENHKNNRDCRYILSCGRLCIFDTFTNESTPHNTIH